MIKTLACVTVLWIFASLFALVKTYWIALDQKEDVFICKSLLSENAERVYTIFKWIMCFVMPYTLILILSVLLLRFFARLVEASRAHDSSQSCAQS
jgi:hypothetical protein